MKVIAALCVLALVASATAQVPPGLSSACQSGAAALQGNAKLTAAAAAWAKANAKCLASTSGTNNCNADYVQYQVACTAANGKLCSFQQTLSGPIANVNTQGYACAPNACLDSADQTAINNYLAAQVSAKCPQTEKCGLTLDCITFASQQKPIKLFDTVFPKLE
eukprot:TRINITY_DN2061_c0_g2_i1.p1 TRINITY_DN2061_c0_g2~~TRINITY_DN2061_c0_g2_i1.p1  ORF type:complete len:164 (-),score=55.83 TRINITY_DN2061_c0_g2_i1:142-633(-)